MNAKELEDQWAHIFDMLGAWDNNMYINRIKKAVDKLQMHYINAPDKLINEIIFDLDTIADNNDMIIAKKKWRAKLIVSTPKQRREAK